MSKTVTIVDYGRGNLFSVAHALEHLGATPVISSDPRAVEAADRLILPGVGAFGDAANALEERGLSDPIRAFVATGRPFLGVCVGMQLILDYSEEFGRHDGLGILPGHVSEIPNQASDGTPHKIPHIGWSGLEAPRADAWNGTILRGIDPDTHVYFVHSFMAVPAVETDNIATTRYDGVPVSAVIARENVAGCQFHPEKSGPDGLRILDNFMNHV